MNDWLLIAADENTHIPQGEKQGAVWSRFRQVLWDSRDPEVYAEWYHSLGHDLLPNIAVFWWFFSIGAEQGEEQIPR